MKYGIFGGAFDPVHLEHLHVMQSALNELGLDAVVVVPSGNAPHKSTATSYQDRVALLERTLEGDARFIVDDLETRLTGVTNTARILPLLKEKYGDIRFIMGGDSFFSIETWISPNVILSYPLAVVPRAGKREALLEKAAFYNAKGCDIKVLQYVGKEVSSTEIRTRLALGLPSEHIAQACLPYIRAHGLYAYRADMIMALKERLPEKRFLHSLQVVVAAVKLNEQLGLPYDKVFVAALLHDCAKYTKKPHPEVPAEYSFHPIGHAFFGAEEAREDFGVKDEDVLNAIRYHTTGRPAMSDLERLIYLADLIEDSRTFEGVEELRKASYEDFNRGFLLSLTEQRKYLGNGENVCPLTAECYNYYVQEGKK